MMQREEVDFCGYSVPHPYEPKMNIRVQTTNVSSMDALLSGLKDLEEICNIIEVTFDKALENYNS